MVVESYWGYFLLWTFGLCMNSYFLNRLVPVCKMSCEYLLSLIWLRYWAAYLPFSWVLTVPLVLLGPLRLCYLSFCLTLSVSLLCILLLLNCGSILSVYQLLPLCRSIGFSLLPILLSNLYSSHIFLHQNNPKSLSLIPRVIEFLNL